MVESGFRHIMVATDLDEASALTMQYAGVLAERFHSRTTVLYAEQIFFPGDEMPPMGAFADDPERAGAERAIRDYARQWLPAGVPVDMALVPGHPASIILGAVREHDPDLLVIGTHGRSVSRRMLAPAVAENVVRRADRPVLVVPSQRAVAGPRPTPGITRIVCPVNFSDVARDALQLAAMLTEAFLAELTVVHVVESGGQTSEGALREQVCGWIAPSVADRCVYREVLVRGSAAERIVDAVEDFGADLLVLGAQQSRFRGESVIGTTTERLVRLARFPILTVVRQPAERLQREEEEAPALATV